MARSWVVLRLPGPGRRIVAMIGLVVLLLAMAIGVTLWRYGVANEKYRQALTKSQTIALVEHATDKLVDVSTTVNTLAVGRAGGQLAALQQVLALGPDQSVCYSRDPPSLYGGGIGDGWLGDWNFMERGRSTSTYPCSRVWIV